MACWPDCGDFHIVKRVRVQFIDATRSVSIRSGVPPSHWPGTVPLDAPTKWRPCRQKGLQAEEAGFWETVVSAPGDRRRGRRPGPFSANAVRIAKSRIRGRLREEFGGLLPGSAVGRRTCPKEQPIASQPAVTQKPSQEFRCPRTGHDYQRIDMAMSWEEAKKHCEGLGGHLVTITSAGGERIRVHETSPPTTSRAQGSPSPRI